jgi:L-asparaginase
MKKNNKDKKDPLTIYFITTGGSIDKNYSAHSSDLEVSDSIIHQFLDDGEVSFKYDLISVSKKDSLIIDNTDREKMINAIIASNCSRIIITHGTDTMVTTGRYILDRIKDKIIVLTGALKPAHFRNTDAILNVGMAIGAVQSADPGVYVAMNGLVLPVGKIEKDMKEMKFKPILNEYEEHAQELLEPIDHFTIDPALARNLVRLFKVPFVSITNSITNFVKVHLPVNIKSSQ